jgi:carboxyl-terminal processing protease
MDSMKPRALRTTRPLRLGWLALLLAVPACRAADRRDASASAPSPSDSTAERPTTSASSAAAADGPVAAPAPKTAAVDPPAAALPRKPPNGAPPRLSCAAARKVAADVQARLAAPTPELPSHARETFEHGFVDATVDWMDPHGLWSAAPDAPLAAVLKTHGGDLRAVLEGRTPEARCEEALRPIGTAMAAWIATLRLEYERGEKEPLDASEGDAERAAGEGVFEDGPVSRPARTLARTLGRRAHAVAAAHPELAPELARARDRWLPALDAAAWSEVALAASLRAWVPLVDPHGAWAPIEESVSLYDRDLESAPPPRLWASATRTVIGARVDAAPAEPLKERDLVVAVDGVSLAGLSAESIDQLAEGPPGMEGEPRKLTVLRAGSLRALEIRAGLGEDPATLDALPTETLAYGDDHVLLVRIADVPDALGDDLARALAKAKGRAGSKPFAGVVLDLRGNGGGSIDGATSALGLFLPGAPLFPLKHRDGAVETERATEPPLEDRWLGPLAVLVDGGTASAAEMIAGALHAYRRGVVLGASTYGKGCAQEYVEDATGLGVLRLTTLLFALPDGAAVQQVGLRPDVALALPPASVRDREAELMGSLPPWSGPDVRDPKRVAEVAWPVAKRVGPCKDKHVCGALGALGAPRAVIAKKR